jgi:hypothetical protein
LEKRVPELDPGGWPRAQKQMTEIDHLCEKLQATRVRFQQHHKNITALRDGLFSASAVMESRASTRLGGQLDFPHDREWLTNAENVRLLAFVGIFFLPLAFCTSLGNMSDALFPLHVLIYVIILVGFVTYMVVFNLDTLVRLFTNTYESHRNSIVDDMKSEKDEYWRSKGEEFGNFYFRPKTEAGERGSGASGYWYNMQLGELSSY